MVATVGHELVNGDLHVKVGQSVVEFQRFSKFAQIIVWAGNAMELFIFDENHFLSTKKKRFSHFWPKKRIVTCYLLWGQYGYRSFCIVKVSYWSKGEVLVTFSF